MIIQKTMGQVGDGRNWGVFLPVELTYDRDHNPIAVQMIVTHPQDGDVVWVFGRSLLAESMEHMNRLVGLGDVRMNSDHGYLVICLHSGDGHADIRLPREAVAAFLDGMFSEVPAGQDVIHEQEIDDFLKEVFEA